MTRARIIFTSIEIRQDADGVAMNSSFQTGYFGYF